MTEKKVDFDNFEEIETVKYRWECPECSKEVTGSTKNQCRSHAKQHYYSRHD